MQSLASLGLPLYLYFIIQNPFLYCFCGFFLIDIGCVLLFWLPESPKFYYARKEYAKCERSLNIIAKFNGVERPIDMTDLILREEDNKNKKILTLVAQLTET